MNGEQLRFIRAFLLVRWPALATGCVIATGVAHGPVESALWVAAAMLVSFGAGVRMIAAALAEEFRTMEDHVRKVEKVNRRIVERAGERRRAS